MSTLDQPLLIANSNYHIGQQIAVFVADEQGYFREEGFTSYDYDGRGLIPSRLGSGLAIRQNGRGYGCRLTFIKAKPILRFDSAGSHIS